MDTLTFNDFESAGRAVLAFLHRRLGFDLWMVTRTEGEDWIVLQSEDHGYGVAPGAVFRWADSFCAEMVQGHGPRIAPRSDLVPAYAAAPIGKQIQIRAYVGMPLVRQDGGLFGTLCAIHPSSQPQSIADEEGLVELLGALLSKVLQADLNAMNEARRTERLEAEALSDPLTQTYNRRGWDRLMASEEDRCRRFGHSAAVMIIDLDQLKAVNDAQGHAAGDALIAQAGAALRHAARAHDVLARIGGDEFGILCIESDPASRHALLERVRATLADANVKASVGFALRHPAAGLQGAWEQADRMMYEEKRSRQAPGPTPFNS
ncbi:MAG TPA: sensor domain-containing diguanylate cyclase [Thermoanaerobaculia bacterium]|jgi:diguanylate cyclase (GGDEF)-like protein|nr:sensor domain-containing diguanylate cyclase [Thermoanaerobaculia bacterium]